MRARIWLPLWLALGSPAWGLNADEQMRFADGIYLRGFYETAVGEYLVLLRDYPASLHVPAALYRAGECYRQMGNQTGAERFYQRVAAEYPDSEQAPRAQLRRAEAAIAAGRYADALPLLQAVGSAQPAAETAAAATYYLGFARWKSGDRRDAEAAYAQILKDHGQSPYAAYAALDLVELHAGETGTETNVAAWCEQAVAAAATPAVKAEALFRWGDWAYRQERYQTAADVLQTLQVELPGEPRARDALRAAGWSLYYLDRAPEALAMADKQLAVAPDAESAAAALYLRANCLRKMNRDGEALGDYERVAREYPGTSFAGRAAYEIMATHFKRGEWEPALVAAPPQPDAANAADVLWMRAESERALGRVDLARGRYETLVREFPKAPQAVPALLRLGEMARAAGQWQDAARLFRRVAEEHPRHEAVPAALQASALARQRGGDAAGALADWDALLSRKPDENMAAEARLQKALVLVELKKRQQALEVLDALVRDRPDGMAVARAQYWRGALLADREQWESAENALRASLSAGPDAQTASLARLRLAVVLQRQGRLDEAADQIEPLLADDRLVADNSALVEWLAHRRFDQGQYERTRQAAQVLAANAREASWRQIGWYWAGVAQAQLGNEKAALEMFEKAVAEKAETREGAEAQLLLANLELKDGRSEEAAARYAAAAEAATGEAALDLRVRAYFGLGEAAEAAGQPEQAARHFLSVAVLFDDPEWTPHALYRAGRLFGQLGKPAEQAGAWQELKRRYPESSFARQVDEDHP